MGVVQEPSAVRERMLTAVASLRREEFQASDILRCDPGLGSARIREALAREARHGSIERVSPGRFRKGGTRISLRRLPSAVASVAVWAVLSTDPQRRFLRLAEVTGEAESFIERPGKDLRSTVGPILYRWHRTGHLDRTGEPGEYRYRLKDSVTQRPLNSIR